MKLGFYSRGNGTSVCDRDREENGDYLPLAHISEMGEITYTQEGMKLDNETQKLIVSHAASNEFTYRNHTIRKNQVSVTQGSFFVLDSNREKIATYSMELPNPVDGWLMNDSQIKKYLDLYFFN